jgi:hypothetical protein
MSLEQRCPSSARDCHGNYRSDKRGLLLYEDEEPPIPEAMRYGPMSDEEFEAYRHEAYEHLINRESSVELLAFTDDNSQPAGDVGNEDFDWAEASPSPVLVVRRAWDR